MGARSRASGSVRAFPRRSGPTPGRRPSTGSWSVPPSTTTTSGPGRRRRRPLRGGGIGDRDRRSTGRGPVAPAAAGRRDRDAQTARRRGSRSCGQICAALFATDRDGRWQSEALDRIFDDVLELRHRRGRSVRHVARSSCDVRRLIDERLESLPGRPDYFRGGITVSSLTPLRWVPFRVVCLLGMDQSAFGVDVLPRRRPGRGLARTGRPRPQGRSAPVVAGGGAGRRGPSDRRA